MNPSHLRHEAIDLPTLAGGIAPGSHLLRSWPLKGGISAEMTAFELVLADGATRALVLRRPGIAAFQHNPGGIAAEFKLLSLLDPLGLSTPRPWHLFAPGELCATSALVIEYIEGQPDFSPGRPDETTVQMAAQLARFHHLDCRQPDLTFLPGQPIHLNEIIGPSPRRPDNSMQEERIRATLNAAWPFPHPNQPRLLHGDYWPGNILWQDGQLVGVIDWEDAMRGDPLADLALSRLDIRWIYGAQAMDAFTAQYLSQSASDLRDLPYWDLCAALRLVRLAGANLTEWAAFFLPYGRMDISEQSIRSAYTSFINDAYAQLNPA
jgi:aminoglycoside phosphotransferase (APT) family kinase protein